MRDTITIKINFRGGIISPGDLYNILVAAGKSGIYHVSFGLRQQLLISVDKEMQLVFLPELDLLGVQYETDSDEYPNIISSYPAEEVFINKTWLSEGVYKDILDGMDYRPKLKINISDSNQSFTPMLTGNINWVASSSAQHFWHLFIRFPKTNTVYEWTEMLYTNDVPALSHELETMIFQQKELFYDNANAKGEQLFSLIDKTKYNTRTSERPAALPFFNLPYYEGLNRINNKYWLGVYRRDELFSIDFLKAVCLLCLETKIGQLCSTPWKTIIVKGIEEKDKDNWSRLLGKHNINMRHAANELNFQVEDNSSEALLLKQYLVKQLNNEDTRTFGICIGIKARKKSEVFSSILIRRKPLIKIFGLELFCLYDILCAKDFNPNERTGFVFSKNNLKFVLGEQLRCSVLAFIKQRACQYEITESRVLPEKEKPKKLIEEHVYQCKNCFTVYDEAIGEPATGIGANTLFESLPADFTCSMCDSSKKDFVKKSKTILGLQTI